MRNGVEMLGRMKPIQELMSPACVNIWNSGTSTNRPANVSSGSASSGNYITAERAQQIALAECPSGSTVYKCQFDWDDGRAEYEVEIRNGWTEYDFEIDAVTGTILSRDIDNDRYD